MQELIKSSGLTIKQFSEEYGIPYNSVRQWANGERQAPEYLKKLIEKNRNLKTKGEQLKIENTIEGNYYVEIRHIKTNTKIYSRTINEEEYKEFDKNYWHVEYVKNQIGYKEIFYKLIEV